MSSKLWLGVLAALSFTGCSSPGPQVLTGRVGPGFPSNITTVKVLKGTTVVAHSPVNANGTFRLEVAPASGLSLRFVGTGQDNLVLPRKAGTIQRTFAIRGGGVAFNLGAIRFVGSSGTTGFAYHTSGDPACDDAGHDAMGATCVDDDTDTEDSTCETEADAGEGSGSGSGSSSTAFAPSDGADGPDQGDAVPEHDFPENGCADGHDNGGDDGTDDGSDDH